MERKNTKPCESKTLPSTFPQREWVVEVLFHLRSAKVALILQSLLLPLLLQNKERCLCSTVFSLLAVCVKWFLVVWGLETASEGSGAKQLPGPQQHAVLQRLLRGSCWGTRTVAASHLGEWALVRRMVRNQESGTRRWLFIQKTTGMKHLTDLVCPALLPSLVCFKHLLLWEVNTAWYFFWFYLPALALHRFFFLRGKLELYMDISPPSYHIPIRYNSHSY